jgi:hypothetical protein
MEVFSNGKANCFTVRQILEECSVQYIDAHQLFINFSRACDTVWRKEMWSEMHTLGFLPPSPPPKEISSVVQNFK